MPRETVRKLMQNKPGWLRGSPLVQATGNVEPLVFVRRRGHAMSHFRTLQKESGKDYATAKEAWLDRFSDETIKQQKEYGNTFWLNHLHKGLGLEAEREDREQLITFVPRLHKSGIRVAGYLGSNLIPETFFLENPGAEEWLSAYEYWGKPVHYTTQYFRRRVYFAHPEYIAFHKKVLQMGIEEYDLDGIWFDNCSSINRPECTNHPLAEEHFREFLRNKYTPEKLKERLGFSDMRYVQPPPDLANIGGQERFQVFYDPLIQEWIDFRCQNLSDYVKEMAGTIRTLDPDVAVILKGTFGGDNDAWKDGYDFARMLPYADVMGFEGGHGAGIDENGSVISNIRIYKMARMYDVQLFNRRGGPAGQGFTPLTVPTSLAFGIQSVGPASEKADVLPKNLEYIKFFHKHFKHYQYADNIADVAILRSFASMAYNNFTAHESTILFEQVLIQAKIPFDIIFDEHLKDLSKYKVLVLANQESLSDEQCEIIREFVKQGGGVVATDRTSLFDEWRRRRPRFGLQDLFQAEIPPIAHRGQLPVLTPGIREENRFGKGRAVYISRIIPSVPRRPDEFMRGRFWALPKNWEELVDAMRWAANGKFSVGVDAPLTVLAEFQIQKKLDKRLVHLVNYNVEKEPVVENIEIDMAVPSNKKIKHVFQVSADEDRVHNLAFEQEGDRVFVKVPLLKTYSIIVIR